MEFINIPTALFSSPEYIGAEPRTARYLDFSSCVVL